MASAPASAPAVDESDDGAGALLSAVEEEHTGSYDGLGFSKFRNGNTYQGEFKEFKIHGRGEYSWTGLGVTYDGQFEDNQMRGEGRYAWPDGSVYEGQVLDGLRHGHGVFTGPHGMCRYAGEWRAGRRHGEGKLEYDPQGASWYEGGWEADQKHGQGKMVYKSGAVYVGQWERNVKSGRGEMHWARTAEVYRGQWLGGLQDGYGEHEWLRPQNKLGSAIQLRERYVGQWRAGKRHGHGTFIYANGSAYRGGWRDNLKHGEGAFVFADGSVYEGPFEDDRMARDGDVQPPADAAAVLDVAELVASEKDPELSAKDVSSALVRFDGEVKRTYRFYAGVHCSPEDAFTLVTEQLDALLHDTKVVTLELSLADAHRVFFGALLRPGVGQSKPKSAPKLSVAHLVQAARASAESEPAPSLAAASASMLHEPTRPVLLREFSHGLARLAHARHAQLPSLAQRVHELLSANIIPNSRGAPTDGLSDAELERALALKIEPLEAAWPAVRGVCRAFGARLRPLWLACARPYAEDLPAHRRPGSGGDETARCRDFALLLRRTRLIPPGMAVPELLVETILQRYEVALTSEPAAAADQHAQLLALEITHGEFCRGLCRVAMLLHSAALEAAPEAAAPGADAADGEEAAPQSPLPPSADAPLAEVVEYFFENQLLQRWAEYQLEQQVKAMEILISVEPEVGPA